TPAPGEDDSRLKITNFILPIRIDSSKGADLTIQGKGFVAGDQVIFEASSKKYTITAKSVTTDHLVLVLPQDMISNSYKVIVKRGSQTFLLGSTVLNLYFNPHIPDKAGMTVKGVVYSGGAGMPNVVVSDGFEVTQTDANGIYYLPSTKKSNYVFVSIPGN